MRMLSLLTFRAVLKTLRLTDSNAIFTCQVMSRHFATHHKSATAAVVARAKKIIGLALDPKLLDRLEKWRQSQDVPPTKTAVHEAALSEFLEKREVKKTGGRA